MSRLFTLRIKIYYEDTDFTGSVYYANYLRFFERGRSEAMGTERLSRDYDELGVGLVVYKADLTFLKPARYGDEIEVRSRAHAEGDHRLVFDQQLFKNDGPQPLVKGIIQLAQVDREGRLMPLRDWIKARAAETG